MADEPRRMAKVQCHTDIPYAELAEGDDTFADVTVEELLDEMGSGLGDDADSFFARAKSAATRRSYTPQGLDPLGVRKASQQMVEQHAGHFEQGHTVAPPFDFIKASALMLTDTWHSRCVEIKAKIAAGLDWQLMQRDGIEPSESEHSAKIRALFADPNSTHEEIHDIARCVMLDQESLGNAWIEVVRDNDEDPVELWHVPGISVRVDAKGRGFWQVGRFGENINLRFFKHFGDTAIRSVETGDVMLASEAQENPDEVATELIHFAAYHPLGGVYGIPSWIAAELAIRANRATLEFNSDYFEHQTIPNKIIVFKGMVPDKRTQKKLEDYFEVALKGRSHKPLILSVDETEEGQGIDVTDLKVGTGGSSDGDFLKLGDATRDEIIAAHGVPPQMLGIQAAGRLGGKGSEEGARRDFKSFVIEPLQTGFERVIRKTLIDGRIRVYDHKEREHKIRQAGFGDIMSRLKLRDFDLSDQDATLNKAREMRSAVGTGLMTINEARIEMGRPPMKDVPMADELWVQTSAGPRPLRAMDPTIDPGAIAPEPEQSDDQIEDQTHADD